MRLILSLISAFVISLAVPAQKTPEGLFINSKAPDFRAKDQSGLEVHLKDLLKKGKVVLIFYQGQWSPYCNRELRNFNDSVQQIIAKGATLVAVTPEMPENIMKTIEKTSATFSILSDTDLKIMKAYDVAYQVDANTLTRYHNTGIDLQKNNGKNGNYLPVPAAYIIEKESSTITYRFFEPNYKKRPSVKEILANL